MFTTIITPVGIDKLILVHKHNNIENIKQLSYNHKKNMFNVFILLKMTL